MSIVTKHDVLFQVNLASKCLRLKTIYSTNLIDLLKSVLEYAKNYRNQFKEVVTKSKIIANE